MPKKRSHSDSEDDSVSASASGSGSDSDVEVKKKPEKKKTKPASKGGSSSSSSKEKSESNLRVDDAEDPTWQIDRMRRITVREFKGKAYVDIREFYEKDGKLMPGKKGISLTPQQFQKFKSIMPDIEQALKEL